MKLLIDTTPEQDAALAAQNEKSNAGQAAPPLEEYAVSALTSYLDGFVAASRADDKSIIARKLEIASPEKLEAVKALLADVAVESAAANKP